MENKQKQITKTCAKCKQELPISNFYFRKDHNSYRPACKKCKYVNTKEEIQERVNAEFKTCKHCGINKPVSEYQKAGGGKWTQPYCKPCDAERKRKHWESNRDEMIKKSNEYYQANKESISEKGKLERLEKRPETLKRIKAGIEARKMSPEERKRRKSECDRRYRENNPEKIKENKRRYYEDGRGLERAKEWQAKKMNDIEFRIKKNLRGRIYMALNGRAKKSDTTVALLGCSIAYFREYFISLFTDGMSWNEYLNGEIHIDHIVPCVSFDLTDEEQQRKCFHYTNLQPLWKIDNLKKGIKYEVENK